MIDQSESKYWVHLIASESHDGAVSGYICPVEIDMPKLLLLKT